MSVCLGDLVRFSDAICRSLQITPEYAVVQFVDVKGVWGNWRPNIAYAEAFFADEGIGWGCVPLDQIEVVRKGSLVSNSSTSRCSCAWSMLTRGCECGAIKKYKGMVGA